jgi:hypothetical protein
MVEPLEDEIVQRAKAICRDDGKIWDVDELQSQGDSKKMVDDASRTEYLNRAREQFVREQANETSPRLP